jgi:hypothetical protein
MKTRLLAVLAILASSAAAAPPYVNAKWKKAKPAPARAIVLPAQVAISRVGVKGGEGLEQEAASIADKLYRAVSAELSARGVSVLPNPADLAKDDAARYRIADLQTRFDQVLTPVKRKPWLVVDGKYTMGDQVAAFQPGQADVLVFVRGSGYVQTSGRKASAAVLLNPFMAVSRFQGDVTLVDAASGEVVAFLRFGSFRDLSRRAEEQLQEKMHDLLRIAPLPKPWAP